MDIQRLRNLTTGRLHTKMQDIYQDIEFLTKTPGIFTHQIPKAADALKPWLQEKVTDPRFWEDKFDQTHIGEIELEPMTAEEVHEFFIRYMRG